MRASAALYPAALAGTIAAIFVADTVTDRNIVVAMFYVAPVLLATRALRPAISIATAAACAVLTVASFLMSVPAGRLFVGVANLLITLGVIAITTLLALRGRAADQRVRE